MPHSRFTRGCGLFFVFAGDLKSGAATFLFLTSNKKEGAGGSERVGAVPEKLTINFTQPYRYI